MVVMVISLLGAMTVTLKGLTSLIDIEEACIAYSFNKDEGEKTVCQYNKDKCSQRVSDIINNNNLLPYA